MKRNLRQKLQASSARLVIRMAKFLQQYRGVAPAKAEELAAATIARGIDRTMERLTTGKNK